MNKFLLLIGWMIVSLGPLGEKAIAQSPHANEIHSMHRTQGCSTLESLILSPDQRGAIKEIEEQRKNRILTYQKNLMIHRIELRNLLRDGQVSENLVQKKSQDLGAIQRLLYDEMMAYQLDIRKILTPEQLSNWCTLIGGKNSHGGWR